MQKTNKKGVAPYVSWVLLIALAASLSVFMYSWITEQADTSSAQIEQRSDTSLCEDARINLDSVCQNTQTLNMNVTNANILEINRLDFRFFDLYDNTESRSLNITIRTGDTEIVEVLKQGTLSQAEIIPVLIRGGKIITCTKSMITVENIKVC